MLSTVATLFNKRITQQPFLYSDGHQSRANMPAKMPAKDPYGLSSATGGQYPSHHQLLASMGPVPYNPYELSPATGGQYPSRHQSPDSFGRSPSRHQTLAKMGPVPYNPYELSPATEGQYSSRHQSPATGGQYPSRHHWIFTESRPLNDESTRTSKVRMQQLVEPLPFDVGWRV